MGGDSEPGSESDDETRLREAGAMTLLDGTGKLWNDSGKLNLKKKIVVHEWYQDFELCSIFHFRVT